MIIAFTGEKKSGKDFFCEFLGEKLGAERLSFSDEVRRLAHDTFPWLPFHIHPDLKDVPFEHISNPNNFTPREIWLRLAKVRDIDPHFFVKKFVDNVWGEVCRFSEELYIITDLRTEEEYMFLKEHDVPIIKIVRENRDGIKEDDFEDWVREFTRYDELFVNKMNGSDDFEKFFTQFMTKIKG